MRTNRTTGTFGFDYAKGMVLAAITLIILYTGNSLAEIQVGKNNLDEFKSEFKKALPPGSKRSEIEDYLENLGLEYGYYGHEYGYRAIIRNIYRRWLIYSANLQIVIHLDKNETLSDIEFFLSYTGP